MMNKFFKNPAIITCALTGNVPTKAMCPSLPIAPEEIAEQAIEVYKAGCSLVHIHARGEDELPTQDLDTYRRIVKMIKEEAPDLIVQLTTGGRSGTDSNLRCDVIRLCPEMGSFTTGSNNLGTICYDNNPDFLIQLASVFKETGVVPELECFDAGHIENAFFLREKGLLDKKLRFNFVLGSRGAASGMARSVTHMADRVMMDSPDNVFTVTGLGWNQFPLVAIGLAMGANVRVGMEDMVLMPNGESASNLDMVNLTVKIANDLERDIATPEQAREILGLDPANKDRILDFLEIGGPIFYA